MAVTESSLASGMIPCPRLKIKPGLPALSVSIFLFRQRPPLVRIVGLQGPGYLAPLLLHSEIKALASPQKLPRPHASSNRSFAQGKWRLLYYNRLLE